MADKDEPIKPPEVVEGATDPAPLTAKVNIGADATVDGKPKAVVSSKEVETSDDEEEDDDDDDDDDEEDDDDDDEQESDSEEEEESDEESEDEAKVEKVRPLKESRITTGASYIPGTICVVPPAGRREAVLVFRSFRTPGTRTAEHFIVVYSPCPLLLFHPSTSSFRKLRADRPPRFFPGRQAIVNPAQGCASCAS